MIERGYLGEVLEELRLERGLSLRDLAKQAGLTAGYLSALESGKQKNPSLEKLRGLAAALGVSITVVRDEPGYIRVSEGDPEDRSYVRSGVPTIREELDEAKDETHYKPDWTSSPGDTIADILEERGLTPEDLAGRADLSVKFVEELLKGRAVITHEVAVGLEVALGSSAEFWMAREFHYRKALAEKVVIGVDPGAGPDTFTRTIYRARGDQSKLESHRYFSEYDDEPNLDPKKLLQEEVGRMREAVVQTMLSDSEAEMLRNSEDYAKKYGLGMLTRRIKYTGLSTMFNSLEAWKAGRADSATDPNGGNPNPYGGNPNPYEKALALERRRFEWAAAERVSADLQATDPLFTTIPAPPPELLAELEAYKPLPRTDAPQPDSDGTAPLGEE